MTGDWWFNLRPSNTEPLLRLNLEELTVVRNPNGRRVNTFSFFLAASRRRK